MSDTQTQSRLSTPNEPQGSRQKTLLSSIQKNDNGVAQSWSDDARYSWSTSVGNLSDTVHPSSTIAFVFADRGQQTSIGTELCTSDVARESIYTEIRSQSTLFRDIEYLVASPVPAMPSVSTASNLRFDGEKREERRSRYTTHQPRR